MHGLKLEVKEIKDFIFASQLRKLLKRLLHYIITKYFSTCIKCGYKQKIYFIRAPVLASLN